MSRSARRRLQWRRPPGMQRRRDGHCNEFAMVVVSKCLDGSVVPVNAPGGLKCSATNALPQGACVKLCTSWAVGRGTCMRRSRPPGGTIGLPTRERVNRRFRLHRKSHWFQRCSEDAESVVNLGAKVAASRRWPPDPFLSREAAVAIPTASLPDCTGTLTGAFISVPLQAPPRTRPSVAQSRWAPVPRRKANSGAPRFAKLSTKSHPTKHVALVALPDRYTWRAEHDASMQSATRLSSACCSRLLACQRCTRPLSGYGIGSLPTSVPGTKQSC